MHNPPILLFDEPYVGLDYAATEMLQQIFGSSRKGGKTILLTTHDFDKGLEQCDNVAVLVQGRLVYAGAAGSIDRARLITFLTVSQEENDKDCS